MKLISFIFLTIFYYYLYTLFFLGFICLIIFNFDILLNVWQLWVPSIDLWTNISKVIFMFLSILSSIAFIKS